MFGVSSVRYGSFAVRANFRSIILGVNSGRISVRSVRVILIGSLLPGLIIASEALGSTISDQINGYDEFMVGS